MKNKTTNDDDKPKWNYLDQFKQFVNQAEWRETGPWVVTDSEVNHEWLLVEPVRFYLVKERGGWFVCDQCLDLIVPGTAAPTRSEAIRRFYKLCGRPMPEGEQVPRKATGRRKPVN